MKTHEVLRKYLMRKKKKYGFSMRALATELDVSVSFLSRIFSGEKPIPYALLIRMQGPLDIESEVFEILRSAHVQNIDGVSNAPIKGKVNVRNPLQNWHLSERKTFSILRNWYYLPILEFYTLKNFKGSVEEIAQRLELSKTSVEIAVQELVRAELLEKKGDTYVKTSKLTRWGSSQSISEIRQYHDQMMTRAQLELRKKTEKENFERRLITGITLTTSPKKLKWAKKQIAEFMHDLADQLISDEDTEVYQFAVQLFPLTKK